MLRDDACAQFAALHLDRGQLKTVAITALALALALALAPALDLAPAVSEVRFIHIAPEYH